MLHMLFSLTTLFLDLVARDHVTANQEIYKLIGSSKITKNVKLLRCLEQRCGILIIEREYEKILKSSENSSSKMCWQPDLILDHRACVVIENIINFANEEGYKNIVDLVLSISFKSQICSIILVSDKNRNSEYVFFFHSTFIYNHFVVMIELPASKFPCNSFIRLIKPQIQMNVKVGLTDDESKWKLALIEMSLDTF